MIGTAMAAVAIDLIGEPKGNTALERSFIGQQLNYIDSSLNRSSSWAGNYINSLPKLSTLETELFSYLELEDGWDGYDAVAPNPNLIYSCYDLLKMFEASHIKTKKTPKIMLSSAGEVGIYWKFDNLYIEIAIDSAGFYSYLVEDKLENNIFGYDDLKIDDGLPIEITNRLLIRSSQDSL